ncbi:hypothetical protein BN977_03416 [Mycolicibacterium cosmeticum]|uniref:Uncharacterized protein n=2 Tax=Mycolicibacterium cosmeticum TaxID=258533 RepID=W9B0E1_MYCCO|nr:hypothetical protein BN977_03416 [Mycolicibacterium cosmeticum]
MALFAVLPMGAAAAQPPAGADAVDGYPLAQGNYSSPDADDFAWVFFKTPDGRGCGIGPNGGPVGCDAVPYDVTGFDQTVVEPGAPAGYRQSGPRTFTRDVDVLPEGHRLQNWGAGCGVGHQGTVTCHTYGEHGFVLAATYSVFW